MKKINVAELLKDCPQGMELDCTICNGVKFIELDRNPNFPIVVRANNGYEFSLTKYGQVHNIDDAKCIIFPKGKTTWEGFVPPCKFKDGDILATDLGSVFYLNTRLNTDECYGCFVGKGGDGSFHICEPFAYKECCGFATEEEKQKLFKAIKKHGYKWNPETKTLEKLIEPKFKVGDRIILKDNPHNIPSIRIKAVTKSQYKLENEGFLYIASTDEKYVLEDRFDIATLKPFDKVLVRDKDIKEWVVSLFSHCNNLEIHKYSCINGSGYAQCIPYECNQHLLGTTNDCDEYFKTWK